MPLKIVKPEVIDFLTDDSSKSHLVTALSSPGAESRLIGPDALAASMKEFKDRFLLNGTTELGRSQVPISLKKLMDKFTTKATGRDMQGLKIHYGLEFTGGVYQLIYALQHLTMEYQPRDGSYLITEGQAYNEDLAAIPDLENWKDTYQRKTSSTSYYSKVKVKRDTGNFEALDETMDACATIFPWEEEVSLLYQNNSRWWNKGEDFILKISCTSTWHWDEDGGSEGYRHGVCLHLNDGTQDLLRPGSFVSPYRFKGANLGHLCPPRCHKYVTPWLEADEPEHNG